MFVPISGFNFLNKYTSNLITSQSSLFFRDKTPHYARNRHSRAYPVVIKADHKAADDLGYSNPQIAAIKFSNDADTRWDLKFASIDTEAIASTFRRQDRIIQEHLPPSINRYRNAQG